MKRYNPSEIELKWQKIWGKEKTYKAVDFDERLKMYTAEMFPYPSGAGLHLGHVRNFTIVDVIGRFYRQQGFNVLRPIGWDTFGLPAENYAITTGISPQEATKTNIENFKKQFKRLGMATDWDREINTSHPEYYKWTQWIFTKMFEKGLAYQAENYQWWCPVDKTVLANEQVEDGKCWRCGSQVEKKRMKQWFFKITAYADELLEDLDKLDWPEKIKTMQRNWIGRSEGAEVRFAVVSQGSTSKNEIKVFTTRPDTLFGATFLVLAPEHPAISGLVKKGTRAAVEQYCEQAMCKSDVERQEDKEKTGVFTGSYVKNPATGENMPIWVADYVLMGYGEGAIMAVPAHDERDFEFAEKFELPIKQVIEKPEGIDEAGLWTGEGELVNSGAFDGMQSSDAREDIVAWLEQQGIGKKKVTYRMRDWLISRQRYWGAPIPVAYDASGKAHAISEDQLPVRLPEIDDYKPDESGRSPLAKVPEFLKVTIDGEEMERETDTMDGYACSSWYLLRYCDSRNDEAAWNPDKVNYWCPVDFYVGGDHAVAHLLYVRFWCKFFNDLGLVDFREPIKKLLYNGYINAPDGKKMSKSKGNTIDPLELIEQGYGADTVRVYEMFIAPYELDAPWDSRGVGGVYRFLNRVWTLTQEYVDWSEKQPKGGKAEVKKLLKAQNQTVKKVTEDLHRNSFNTAIAAMMEYVNDLYKMKVDGFSEEWRDALIALSGLLKPFAPHLASEVLEVLGKTDDVWPVWDDKYLVADEVEVVVQVNGKVRAKLIMAASEAKEQKKVEKVALTQKKVKTHMDGKELVKIIYVARNHLLNIVVR